MEQGTKAIYNSLRFRAHANETISSMPPSTHPVFSWKTRNWRELSLETLFKELKELGCNLNKDSFRHYAEVCDSPEELFSLLLRDGGGEIEQEENHENEDKLYLLLLELWRRLLPEYPSLPIICDNLDEAIFQYDTVMDCGYQVVQQALEPIFQLLQSNVDEGISPKEAFEAIVPYCAHDIPRFLADYILDLIDQSASDSTFFQQAEELVEQVEPYIASSPWFLLVKAKILALSYNEEALKLVRQALSAIVQQTKQEPTFYIEALGVVRFFDELQLTETLIEMTFNALNDWDDLLQLAEELSHLALVNDVEQIEARLDAYLDRVECSPEITKPFTSKHAFVKELIHLAEECVKTIALMGGKPTNRS